MKRTESLVLKLKSLKVVEEEEEKTMKAKPGFTFEGDLVTWVLRISS